MRLGKEQATGFVSDEEQAATGQAGQPAQITDSHGPAATPQTAGQEPVPAG